MKRMLLVSPPFYRLLGSHYNGINLGISYISSVLNQNGFQSCIYNADYVNSEDYVDQVGLVSAYDDYKRIISDMNHPIWQECVKNILDYKPVYQINVPRVDTINTMRY